ncbi:helix-turn-helix transcriptional regulator [Glaciecola sp. 1036]|uniref:helix-turn-helix transcriptional regulator n=1 Tax=Alteromonadaceae TaxID=72275 RepID=UPI003D05BD59
MNLNNEINILRKPEVIKITGLSNTSIFERTKDGLFPSSVSLGGRAIGYIEHEIRAVLTARAAGHSDQQVRELINSLHKQRLESGNRLISLMVA